MSAEFYIRPVSEQDHPAILEVYRQCEDFLALGPQPRASMEMVLADLKLSSDNGGVFCGIFDARGQMMGVLDYIPSGFEGVAEDAFIELLMIALPYRRCGLGAAVVAWLEELIRADPSIARMRLGTQANNPGGIAFWTRMGYRIVGEPRLMPDGTTAMDLLKDLRSLGPTDDMMV